MHYSILLRKKLIDIEELLKDDANTFNNIKRALVVENQVGKKIFIEQTDVFKESLNKILHSLNTSFTNIGDNYSKLSKEFLGYISVRSYLENLENLKTKEPLNSPKRKLIEQRINSIDLGLVFQELNGPEKDTLARQLDKLKINPTTKDNYIVRYLTTAIANDGSSKEEQDSEVQNTSKNATDYIVSKSFVKESNETISQLIDAVKSLYYNNDVIDETTGLTPRAFVSNMLSYLMVKDNMLFKNNSISKFLPVEMFGNYSKLLDDITEGLVNKESMNMDKFEQLAYNFRKLYVTDKNTSFAAVKYNSVENDGKVVNIAEDGTIDFKVSSKTRLELFIKQKELSNAQARIASERSPELEKELSSEIKVLQERLESEDIATNIKVLSNIFKTEEVTGEDAKNITYIDKKSGETKTVAQFKFPQFRRFKVGKETKVYELKKVLSRIPSYGNGTLQDHKTELGFAIGEQAIYEPLNFTGYKGVSVYFPGTYEKAVKEFSKIKEVSPKADPDDIMSVKKTKSVQQSVQPSTEQFVEPSEDLIQKLEAQALALESLEANGSAFEAFENLPEVPVLPSGNDLFSQMQKDLLSLVTVKTLKAGGVELSTEEYANLKQKIRNAKTETELKELEEIIKNCM